MTDAQLRDAAVAKLKQTTVGYVNKHWSTPPAGSFWKDGLDLLAQIGAVAPPPPLPPPLFGSLLPTRLIESSGSIVDVASLTALTSALNSVAPGDTIRLTQSLSGTGTYSITRAAAKTAPITVTCLPGVRLTGFDVWNVQGAGLRFRDLDISQFPGNGFKVTGAAHDIEIDHCHIHQTGTGILVTASAAGVQIWNNEIHDNGLTNLDHGIYFAWASPGDLIVNNLIYHNSGYGIQAYPKCAGLVLACNTLDDGMLIADPRGGMVLGSEGGQETQNTVNVGLISTNAPNSYGHHIRLLGAGNNVYDALGFGNSAGDFEKGTGVTYSPNCLHADPLYVNRAARDYHLQAGSPAKGHVDQARYGYVPPFDRDGLPRLTADAGCYRVAA